MQPTTAPDARIQATLAALKLRLIDWSADCYLIEGETYPHRDALRAYGGYRIKGHARAFSQEGAARAHNQIRTARAWIRNAREEAHGRRHEGSTQFDVFLALSMLKGINRALAEAQKAKEAAAQAEASDLIAWIISRRRDLYLSGGKNRPYQIENSDGTTLASSHDLLQCIRDARSEDERIMLHAINAAEHE